MRRGAELAGTLRANLDAARIRRDAGVAQYERAIQGAFREVADGLAARGTFDAEVTALERNVAAQRRRLELADFRFRNGVENYLNVLTAQTDLYRALGGGWNPAAP